MTLRLILNGKKAQQEELREAVLALREQGNDIQVRVTWEAADVPRLINEAHQQGWNHPDKKLMIGGGDGSVQAAVSALMQLPKDERPSLAIMPLGTANDFANGCGLPLEASEALQFALDNQPQAIDVIRVEGPEESSSHYFLNVLSAGFAAEVTADTPTELKDLLGGGAYTLSGLLKAVTLSAYKGEISSEEHRFNDELVLAALCNGKQAGGGQELAPKALVNDGLLDVCVIKAFPAFALSQVIQEASAFSQGETQPEAEYVISWQTASLDIKLEQALPCNLDGEPYEFKQAHIEVEPQAITLIVAPDSSCLSRQ
ncbi:lipid kinase YegS [Agarivorans sp.]|uniref:lipid kinase YegS n=1 Tax=Agarivorans sp. TaxID=1872412 RepID=UPI003D03D4D5